MGKYESNATALRLALSYSDRAIEAYDVLVALLESEIALSTERNGVTIDNRRTAENVAHHILRRFENDCANTLTGPWEDSIVLSDEYVSRDTQWCVTHQVYRVSEFKCDTRRRVRNKRNGSFRSVCPRVSASLVRN